MGPIEGESSATSATGDSRVLYVDDDQRLATAVGRLLRSRGFPTDLAASAIEGLQMAQRRHYRIVVTDLNMPGMDGLAMLERMLVSQPDTAFILVTGDTTIDLHEIRSLGTVVAALSKPWDDGEFLRVVHRAVEFGRTEREQRKYSVLLVEDDPADASLVRTLLSRRLGNRVTTTVASTLAEALGSLHEGDFDVVLADLGLPDAAGLDGVRRLRMADPETALIVVSGVEDIDLGIRAIQLGAQSYVAKDSPRMRSLDEIIQYSAERARAAQRLSHLAFFDQLTGLANRTMFQDRLRNVIANSSRTEERFAVLYVDLDGFKPVNDTYGHEVGDRLLQDVASRLRCNVRPGDTVARLGGDEFAILLPRMGFEEVSRAFDRLRAGLGSPCVIDGTAIEIHASFGVAVYPDNGRTLEELLRHADEAMYEAKKTDGTSCERSIRAAKTQAPTPA